MSVSKRLMMKDNRRNTPANDALRKLILCGGLLASGVGDADELGKLWFDQLEKARAAGAFGGLDG